MANFCPICKASCDKQCGLYDKAAQRCSILSLAVKADAVSGLLADVYDGIGSVSDNLESLVCKVIDLTDVILEK